MLFVTICGLLLLLLVTVVVVVGVLCRGCLSTCGVVSFLSVSGCMQAWIWAAA